MGSRSVATHHTISALTGKAHVVHYHPLFAGGLDEEMIQAILPEGQWGLDQAKTFVLDKLRTMHEAADAPAVELAKVEEIIKNHERPAILTDGALVAVLECDQTSREGCEERAQQATQGAANYLSMLHSAEAHVIAMTTRPFPGDDPQTGMYL